MLNLDPAKLLVIAVVAIILLGPDRLPQVAKQVGAAWRSFNEFRHRMEAEVRNTMPDLPPTHEIARLARSPSALLDKLSSMNDGDGGGGGTKDNGAGAGEGAASNGAGSGLADGAAADGPGVDHPAVAPDGVAPAAPSATRPAPPAPSPAPSPSPSTASAPAPAPAPAPEVIAPGDPTLN